MEQIKGQTPDHMEHTEEANQTPDVITEAEGEPEYPQIQ